MKYVPFTVHIEIFPARGSGELKTKRFEIWRDMQKIASMAYDGIIADSSFTVATPGGGQHTSQQGIGYGSGGTTSLGMATKPQFGETPSQISITGFYSVDSVNIQPHPEKMIISAGQVWQGPGSAPWLNGPVSQIDTEVAACKTAIEAALTSSLPSDVDFQVFRLDYSGVTYGDKGYHFPT